jgi:hypothetical protein
MLYAAAVAVELYRVERASVDSLVFSGDEF